MPPFSLTEPINESIEEPINNYPVTTETPHESSRWVEHVTFALAIACRPAGAPIILHQRADVECMSPHHLLFTTVVPLLLFCCSYDSLRRLVKKVLVQRPNPTDKLPLDVILGLLSASAKWILRRLPESVTYGAFIRCVYIVARKREALDKEVAPLTLPAQLAILRSAGYQRGCLALSLSPTADRDLNGDLNLPSYSFFKDLLFHLKWDSRINRYPSHCVVAAVEQNLTSVTSDPTRPVLVLSAYPAIGCRAHGPDSAPRGHLELRCDVATNQVFCCTRGL